MVHWFGSIARTIQSKVSKSGGSIIETPPEYYSWIASPFFSDKRYSGISSLATWKKISYLLREVDTSNEERSSANNNANRRERTKIIRQTGRRIEITIWGRKGNGNSIVKYLCNTSLSVQNCLLLRWIAIQALSPQVWPISVSTTYSTQVHPRPLRIRATSLGSRLVPTVHRVGLIVRNVGTERV